MASPLPTPVNAALGVLPAVLDGVRRLPGKAVQLPVLAISNALTTLDALRREYEDLAGRGERLVARLRGEATEVAGDLAERADELEDRVEDVAGAGFAKAEDTAANVLERARRFTGSAADNAAQAASATGQAVSDASEAAASVAQQAGQTVAGAAQQAGQTAASTAQQAGQTAADVAQQAGQTAADTAQQAGQTAQQAGANGKGVPTPRATEPDTTRVDTAASPSVVQAVKEVAQQVAAPAAPLDHDSLPLPDYDHMTLGSLRGRLRSLSVEQLVQIRTYEKAHADRLPVVTMLDNRIAKLATDPSATPSGPVSTAPAPEQQALATPQPRLSPATTTAPTINPPSHGDPTNPSQPR